MTGLSKAFLRSCGEILGPEGLLTAPEDRHAYSYDLFARGLPDAVALPATTEQTARVLALCADAGVPVTPRGAGTSLTGGPVPVRGGLSLCLARMHGVVELSVQDRLARVKAGTVTDALKRAARRRGLLYPPDPTSAAYCTIGGNVATNAGGASGVKYGVTRDYLLGLTLVTADGDVLTTGSRCVKRSTGYDFTHFLCGSEGRLGVVTEAVVKLVPAPAAVRTLLAWYPNVEAAAGAAAEATGGGVTPSVMEIMDDGFLKAVADVYGVRLPEGAGAALLVETDGSPASVAEQTSVLESALGQEALSVRVAGDEAERETLWKARRGGTAALVRQARFLATLDYAVPVSRIAEAARTIQDAAARAGLTVVIIGHAGDGNLHPMFIFDPDDPRQAAAFRRADADLCAAVLKMGGTLTGEHGIGLEKADLLPRELSPREMALSRRLKRAFDPKGILNPGKCEDGGPA